jgi:DNA-binding transcriptional LysR family regulator
MDVRVLRYFVAVAEEGSIHAGARRMVTAQPALSQALRRLERELGGALFRRSHRGVDLTPAGAALYAHARRVLTYLDDAVQDVRELLDSPRTVLSVGLVCGRVAAADLTAPIVAAFGREHPEVAVEVRELSFTGQVDAVLDGTVDVALVRGPYRHEELRMAPLFSEPLVLAVTAEHPFAGLPEIPVEKVLDEPMLLGTRTHREWRDFWHLTELRNGPTHAEHTPAVTLFEAQVALLTEPAVAAMAASAWRMAVADPMLRAVPMPDAPRSEIGIGFRRGDERPEVSAFVQIAQHTARMMIDVVPGGQLIC